MTIQNRVKGMGKHQENLKVGINYITRRREAHFLFLPLPSPVSLTFTSPIARPATTLDHKQLSNSLRVMIKSLQVYQKQ